MPEMSVSDAVLSRRSIRSFQDRPVPLAVLRDVLDKARMSPSGCNFQPWEAVILAGEPLRALQDKMMAAEPQSPIEYHITPPGIGEEFNVRMRENGALMYGAMGIARGAADLRTTFSNSNKLSFGAPALLLCSIPRVMGPPQWADVGMWLQSIMLLLREQGLDSCPQEFMAIYARLIKEHIGVSDESHILFCGLAIGYRDDSASVNGFERLRVPLDEQARFIGF